MYPDPDYPNDLYVEELKELNRMRISWMVTGMGLGIMFTVAVAGVIVWLGG